MILALHNQKQFGRKLFCNGIIPLTPDKQANENTSSGPAQPSLTGTTGHTAGTSDITGNNSELVSTGDTAEQHLAMSTASHVAPTDSKASPTISHSNPSPVSSVKIPTPSSSMQYSPTPSLIVGSIIDTLIQTGTSTQAIVTPTQIYSFPQASPNSSYNSPPSQRLSSQFPPPNQSLLELGACSDIQQFVNDHQLNLDDHDLVRRHSLSLRTPPLGSLAAEILNPVILTSTATPHSEKPRSLLTNLSEMTSHLSEFESCASDIDSSSDEDSDAKEKNEDGFQTMNGNRRSYKKKRKNSTTPTREYFMKKPNMNASPQPEPEIV